MRCHLLCSSSSSLRFFFFNDTATTEIYTLSLHDALPISEDDTSVSETRKSAFIDLGLDSVVNQGDTSASLVFTNIEATPTPPTTEELEARVADDPDDPEAHQALGEALIEAGRPGRGVEELGHAPGGFEKLGNLPQARHLVEEILRLDPNSGRHRQKQVGYAFK